MPKLDYSPFLETPTENLEAEKVETRPQLFRYMATGYASQQTNAAQTQKARGNGPSSDGDDGNA